MPSRDTGPPTAAELVADLAAEHADLDEVLSPLPAEAWLTPTPSPGWNVADQVGHLGYFDRTAAQAITDPDGFGAHLADMLGRLEAGDDMDALTLDEPRRLTADELLAWWRQGRAELVDAASGLDDATRLPWYGPPMSVRSFLTARLMETWAHGQDVVDAAGAARRATDRLRHIAQLGVITRGWSYVVRGMEAPEGDVGVVLERPAGGTWMWGPSGGPDRIEGPAEDFCLVVTQRRHVADTALIVTGSAAADWMAHAQAFAGGPTEGPAPRRSR